MEYQNGYANFIKDVEAKLLFEERDKYLILADHCTRKWEGEINKLGDSVTILGLGKPTIYTVDINGNYEANGVGAGSVAGKGKTVLHRGIPSAEELKTLKINCPVTRSSFFNFEVGDLDEQQSSVKNGLDRSRPKAAKGIALEQDRRVRDVIVAKTECDFGDVKITVSETPADGEEYILDYIDKVRQHLREKDVSDGEELFGECSAKFYRYLKKALVHTDTNNSKIVRGVECTSYNGITFYNTNTMLKGSDEYVFIRTKEAVAFFDPLQHIEAYRPQEGFADAVKGFTYYDAAVVDVDGCCYSKVTYK